MRILTTCFMSVVFFAAFFSNIVVANELPENKSPLTSIGATTNLDAPPDADDPGIGGGFDYVSYFRNRFVPRLDDCSEKVAGVFQTWGKDLGLTFPLREVTPGDVLMHATKDSLDGLFEMIYRVDSAQEKARVTVFFYSSDGARHQLTAIKQILETWHVDVLQDDLDEALRCGKE